MNDSQMKQDVIINIKGHLAVLNSKSLSKSLMEQNYDL